MKDERRKTKDESWKLKVIYIIIQYLILLILKIKLVLPSKKKKKTKHTKKKKAPYQFFRWPNKTISLGSQTLNIWIYDICIMMIAFTIRLGHRIVFSIDRIQPTFLTQEQVTLPVELVWTYFIIRYLEGEIWFLNISFREYSEV